MLAPVNASPTPRSWPWLLAAMLLSVPFLFLGLGWGLPSKAADEFLFADRTPWTGEQIVALAGGWSDRERQGADVQRDGAVDRSKAVDLNATDAQRADIVRRYRLYTFQPDEMINLRAYSQMRPGQLQLDPRLYQYGGLWFYPGGVLLKLADVAGFVELRGDVAYYLDNPDQAGRIYVVLRAMSAIWALSAVAAVFVLARQFHAAPPVAALTALCLSTAPGVVVLAHEAKPHVAGMALVLWSMVAAVRYVRTDTWRDLVWTTLAAGGAVGMVVSMAPAAFVPLSAVAIRRSGWAVRCGAVLGIGLLTYAVTNPYVIYHLLTDSAVLRGQLGNSTAMYEVGSPLATAGTAFYLLVSLTPAVLAIIPAGLVGIRQKRWPLALMVGGATAGGVLAVFVLLAGGKPGEFARFGLVVAAFGVVALGWLANRFPAGGKWGLLCSVVAMQVVMSWPEVSAYREDATWRGSSREEAARAIRNGGAGEVRIAAEPGPYNLPPVDLWRTRLVLVPPGETPTLLQPPRSDGYWRMSWSGRTWRSASGAAAPSDSGGAADGAGSGR